MFWAKGAVDELLPQCSCKVTLGSTNSQDEKHWAHKLEAHVRKRSNFGEVSAKPSQWTSSNAIAFEIHMMFENQYFL